MRFSKGQKQMLLAVFAFSIMNVCVKALPRLPETEIVFLRSVFSLTVTWFLLKREGLHPWGNAKGWLILRGLVGTFSLFCFIYSVHHLPLATAVTLQNLAPIFTLWIAAVFFAEKSKPTQWVGFVIAFVGVFILKGWSGDVPAFPFAVALTAAACSGLAYNFVRGLRAKDHPLVVVFYFPLVATIVMAPYCVSHFVWPNVREWWLLLGVGISTQIAQTAMTLAYHLESAGQVAGIGYFGPLFALAWGLVFFNENLSMRALFGISIILLGLAVTSGLKHARKAE